MLMMLIEIKCPGRSWPEVAGWWWRAVLFNSCQVIVVVLAGSLWDEWFIHHRLWSADSLGNTWGTLIGYLASTFVYYWWHRWRHEVNFLWRWMHQLHHSPQRIEIVTSFYKHPFELIANGFLTSITLYLLVGLGPVAAAGSVLLSGLAELFYHWNVRTPHWLGCIVQRPESHCLHHQEGVHSYNFGDLPLWDILFGTFKNPQEWQATCGLGPENEQKVIDMLLGRDLTLSSKGNNSL
jgi:sterol desaturase/sphingolipid hydroxylase (fatty acid hydroxylase superfamily)